MADSCCSPPTPSADPAYRRILWIALLLNAAMFAIEVAGSVRSGSVSLLADAIDFLGDAANYGLSLAVLSLALAWRARASLLKAASMAASASSCWGGRSGAVRAASPEPLTMGAIAPRARRQRLRRPLLYRYRTGDSNMRSVWICSRNDAFGNVAVPPRRWASSAPAAPGPTSPWRRDGRAGAHRRVERDAAGAARLRRRPGSQTRA